MRDRLLSAPGWLRAVVYSAVAALAFGVTMPYINPVTVHFLSWWWRCVLLAVPAATFGVLMTVASQPAHRAYLAVTDGLNAAQRSRVTAALRGGAAVTDPAVRTAALQWGTLVSRSARRVRWRLVGVAAALEAAVGGFYLATDFGRIGALWCALAVAQVLVLWLRVRRVRRIRRSVEALETLEADGADGEPITVPDLPIRLGGRKLAGLITIWILTSTIAGTSAFTLGRIDPDCRVAAETVDYIGSHQDVFRLASAGRDEPGVPVAAWSAELHRMAGRVTRPDIASQLQRIATLSDRVVALSADEDTEPGDFTADFNRIVTAEKAVLDACRISYS